MKKQMASDSFALLGVAAMAVLLPLVGYVFVPILGGYPTAVVGVTTSLLIMWYHHYQRTLNMSLIIEYGLLIALIIYLLESLF